MLRYHQNRGELGIFQRLRRCGVAQSVSDQLLPDRFARARRLATAIFPIPIRASRWSTSGVRPNSRAPSMWKSLTPTPVVHRGPASRRARRCWSRSALSRNGAPAGGHFVVATGIAGDGSVLIQDPSPLFSRTNLTDYLSGFSAAGGSVEGRASRRGAVRAAQSAIHALSGSGAFAAGRADAGAIDWRLLRRRGVCGTPFEMLDSVDASGAPSGSGALGIEADGV